MQKTRVRSLGQEDPLEKEMASHSSILAWEIPWTEEPGGLQSMRLQRVGHDWATHNNSNFYTAAHYLSSLTWIDVGLSLCILPLPLAHLVLLLSLSFHSCKMGLSRVPSAFNSPYKSMKVFGKLKRTLRTWIWQPIWMPPHSAAKCISVLASKMEA